MFSFCTSSAVGYATTVAHCNHVSNGFRLCRIVNQNLAYSELQILLQDCESLSQYQIITNHPSATKGITLFKSRANQARRQGVRMQHPRALPQIWKRSIFSHKVVQKWDFCRRAKGVRVQNLLFWYNRSTFLETHNSQNQSWLWAWEGSKGVLG